MDHFTLQSLGIYQETPMTAMSNTKACTLATNKPSTNYDDDSITVWEGMPLTTVANRSPLTVASGISRTLVSPPPTDLLSPATQTLNVLSQNMDDLRYNMAVETGVGSDESKASPTPAEASPEKQFALPPPDPKNCIPLETWQNDYQHQYAWIPVTFNKPGATLGMVIQRDQFLACEQLGQIGLTHCKILRVFPGGLADTIGIRVDDWMCRPMGNIPILALFEEVQEWAKTGSFVASVLRLKNAKEGPAQVTETCNVSNSPSLKQPLETTVETNEKTKPHSSSGLVFAASSNKTGTHLEQQRHHRNQNGDSNPIKKRKRREKAFDTTFKPATPSPSRADKTAQENNSCNDSDDILPFCRLCNHFKKYGKRDLCRKRPRLHHAWCPKNSFFENNGAQDLLDRIQYGRQELNCTACEKEYQYGKLEPSNRHSPRCRQYQKRLDHGTPPTQLTQVEQPQPEKTKSVVRKKRRKCHDKKLHSDQEVASIRKPDRTEVVNSLATKKSSHFTNPKVTTPSETGDPTRKTIVAQARQVTPPPFDAIPKASARSTVQATGDPLPRDKHQEGATPKLRWESTVENPWGVQGFQDGDITLYSPQHGLGHHEILLPSLRYALNPFAPHSNYCTTHCTPDKGYIVLCLGRDPAGKTPWGFGVTRDEFGDACLVDHVQPMTPASGARALGSDEVMGLHVHDMVLMVNGRTVGGMTQVGLELEIESSGPRLTMVISRYKHADAAAQQFAAIERNVLNVMDAACCDERLLGWHEVGNSAICASSSGKWIQEPAPDGKRQGAGIPQAVPETDDTPSQATSDSDRDDPFGQAKDQPFNSTTNTNAKTVAKAAVYNRLPTINDVDVQCGTNEDEITDNDDNKEKEDWEEDQNTWNGCVCGMVHKGNGHMFWIQCEGCNSWYDVSEKCVGFDEKQAKTISKWNCSACKDSQSSRSLPPQEENPMSTSDTDLSHSTTRIREWNIDKVVCRNKLPTKTAFLHDPSPEPPNGHQINLDTDY